MIITDTKILRQISRITSHKEADTLGLPLKLRSALDTGWTGGTGLAAIQIGIPLRFAWFTFQGKEYTLVNPEITEAFGGETQAEGCLSIPGKRVMVCRAYDIRYTSNGKPKRANGLMARIIQHEVDHMNGVLITDKGKAERVSIIK
jgi:peptide deformylase